MEEILNMGTIPQWVTVGWSIGVGVVVGTIYAKQKYRTKHPKLTKEEKEQKRKDAIIAEANKIMEEQVNGKK